MKALYLTGPKQFEIREIERPSSGPGEVAIAVKIVGLCGSDRHYMRDDCPHDFAGTPLIPGHEGAGEIVEVGEGVTGLKVGDRVAIEPARPCRRCETCISGYGNACPDIAFLGYPPHDGLMREVIAYPAEYVQTDESGRLDYLGLMMLEPLAVVVNALDVAGFRVGWTAAVVGCGSIGLCLIATLKAMGAVEIYATDPLEYKRDWALRYGADAFFNPGADDVAAEVHRATGGRGVDVAFECAGQVAAQNQAAALIRPVGVLALIGINPEEIVHLDSPLLRRRALTIQYIRRSNETLKRAMRLATRLDRPLAEMVTHQCPLESAPEAFADFMTYEDGVIKSAVVM